MNTIWEMSKPYLFGSYICRSRGTDGHGCPTDLTLVSTVSSPNVEIMHQPTDKSALLCHLPQFNADQITITVPKKKNKGDASATNKSFTLLFLWAILLLQSIRKDIFRFMLAAREQSKFLYLLNSFHWRWKMWWELECFFFLIYCPL